MRVDRTTSCITAHRKPTSSRATATTAICGRFRYAQVIEPLMQPLLRLPRVRDHRRRLALSAAV